jgi:hypothetical protein
VRAPFFLPESAGSAADLVAPDGVALGVVARDVVALVAVAASAIDFATRTASFAMSWIAPVGGFR